MVVTVNLHTVLQKVTADGRISQVRLPLPESATVQSVLDALKIDYETEHLLLLVNRQHASTDQVLFNEDLVDIIPALSGG